MRSQEKISLRNQSTIKMHKIKPAQIQLKHKDSGVLPKQIVRIKKVESTSQLIKVVKTASVEQKQPIKTLKLKP